MSQASPSTTGSPHAQLPTSKISPPTASTDWLAGLIVGARSAAAAGEFAPFPGIKGAAGAVVSLLETIDKDSRNQDDLKDLAERVVAIIQFLRSEIAAHGQSSASRVVDLVNDFCRQLDTIRLDVVEIQKSRKGFRGRVKGIFLSQSTRDKIETHKVRIAQLHNDLMLATVIDLHRHNAVAEDATLLANLQPISLGDRRTAYAEKCMPGTRTDVFDTITTWLDDPAAPNIFWLTGSPGAGKSAIASTLVGQLLAQGRLGSFIAFKQGNTNLSDATAVWRTVASDLARYPAPSKSAKFHGQIRTALLEVLKDNKIDPGSTDIELQFQSLIEEPFKTCVGLEFPVVVMDALDECGQGQSLQWKVLLKTMKKWSTLSPPVKIFITARSYHSIEAVLGPVSQCIALATGEHVTAVASHDIYQYLEGQIKDNIVAFNPKLPPDWPGPEVLDKLTAKAAGLFIWARTVLIFLEAGDASSRLDLVLSDKDNEQNEVKLYQSVNQLYSTILEFSFQNATTKEITGFRLIAGTLAILRIPVDKDTLVHLLPETMADSTIDYILNQLQPVLNRINPGDPGVLDFCHLSFVEYLTDQAQKPFYIDSANQNHMLASSCLQVMNKGLKFNICDLATSCLSNAEVTNLEDKIKRSIPKYLSYACAFWGDHLDGDQISALMSELNTLFYKNLLFWLEVLSLTSSVHTSFKAMNCAVESSDVQQDKDLCTFIQESIRFVAMFRDPITKSAPHIYISALPFVPRKTQMSEKYLQHFQNTFSIDTQVASYWPKVLHVLEGHTNEVSMAAYSPDGKTIVSGALDCSIRFWDATTGKLLGAPIYGNVWVNSVSFSPDGTKIITSVGGQAINIWDMKNREKIQSFATTCPMFSAAACSPDSKFILSSFGNNAVMMWDIESGKQLVAPMIGHTGRVTTVCYSPDGKTCVSGAQDKTVRLWDATTGVLIGLPLEGHSGHITHVIYSPDGKIIASGSEDKTIRFWDAITHNQIGLVVSKRTDGGKIQCLAYSPDGCKLAFTSGDQSITIWDVENQTEIGLPLEGHLWPVTSVTFSKDGTLILSASADGTVRIWNWNMESLEKIGSGSGSGSSGMTCSPLALDFSANGQHIVAGMQDGLIRIWDVESGEQVGAPFEGHTSWITSVQYSPSNDEKILSSSSDGTIRLWDVKNRKQDPLLFLSPNARIAFATYSSDGKHILSGSEHVMRLWDATTGVQIGSPFIGHTLEVNHARFSPDNTNIISGSYDRSVRQWNLKGEEIGLFLGHGWSIKSVAYSPDGQLIASGSMDDSIDIWNSENGQRIGVYKGSATVEFVEFSHDGTHIFSTSEGQVVILKTGEFDYPKNILHGHSLRITCLAYSHAGNKIATASYDNTIRVWDVEQILQDGVGPAAPILTAGHPMKDGWILNKKKELLLWIPQDLRGGLYYVENSQVINKQGTTQLDFRKFVHGLEWAQCYSFK